MLIIPAIDIVAGKVVRLEKGDFAKATVYALSPLEYAKKWRAEGAAFLHVVDLDGARFGEPKNFHVIAQLIREAGVKTEVGGGVRGLASVQAYLEAGAERVVLSTKVIEDASFLANPSLKEYVGRAAVSIDIRNMATSDLITTGTGGWIKGEDVLLDIPTFVRDCCAAGVRCINFSDIARDGMLSGPDIAKIKNFLKVARSSCAENIFFTYAGGVSSLEDLRHLKSLGADGVDAVIIGRALYENKFTLKAALDAVSS